MSDYFSATDKFRVFLVCRPVFTGLQAQVRKDKAIRKILQKHRQSLGPLLTDVGIERVVMMLKILLEQRIFESDDRAKAQFPELFSSSLAQITQSAETESKAACSTAAFIREIECLESRRDEANLGLGPVLTSESVVEVSSDNMPTRCIYEGLDLHPLRLPYVAQHQILVTVQKVLEECCFEFARKWIPHVLDSRGLECAAAVELTQWTSIFKEHWIRLPPQATVTIDGIFACHALTETHQLRHAAVHRLPLTVREISKYVSTGVRLAKCLRDVSRGSRLDELCQEIETKIRDMELHKNALEQALKASLDLIAVRRKELDKQEARCVEATRDQDRENKVLITSLLVGVVETLFNPPSELQKHFPDCSDSDDADDYCGTVL